MNDLPRVYGKDGRLVLVDPAALGIIDAVERYNRRINKQNCRLLLDECVERVEYFKCRIAESGKSTNDTVIVLLSVDDPHGGPLADFLIPNHDWQPTRDRGLMPIARGLAKRDGMQEVLAMFDTEAAEGLKNAKGTAVVVVAYGVAEIFEV